MKSTKKRSRKPRRKIHRANFHTSILFTIFSKRKNWHVTREETEMSALTSITKNVQQYGAWLQHLSCEEISTLHSNKNGTWGCYNHDKLLNIWLLWNSSFALVVAAWPSCIYKWYLQSVHSGTFGHKLTFSILYFDLVEWAQKGWYWITGNPHLMRGVKVAVLCLLSVRRTLDSVFYSDSINS